jgi:hypothetical protein
MADLFADALMLAIKIFTVSVFLFGLFVMGVIAVVEWARKTARTKKRERGGQR